MADLQELAATAKSKLFGDQFLVHFDRKKKNQLVLPQYVISSKKIRRIRALTSQDIHDEKRFIHLVENMDAYCDKDMGDVIVGKPFCRASCVEARRFDGFFTIHDGNDNVTYQMA
ncbi:hypothetical protein Tco_0493084 [Tanacetum coccineum]